jgi:glutathione S-transferase
MSTAPRNLAEPRATLYVIPGSHACRTAMLMLEHKGISYRNVELLTGWHPVGVRLRGFAGHPAPIRQVDGRTHRWLALLDRLGTVPALRLGSERIQANREIARYLDRVQPEPALFPAEPNSRRAVEEAEEWGDQVLQMAARRLGLAAALRGLDALHSRGNDGRLGALLSPSEPMRILASRISAGSAFRASPKEEPALLAALPAMLDRIDAWITTGVLGGRALNAADFMIAPSLALLSYRLDLRSGIEGRPAGALLDRVLPEPGRGGDGEANKR